MPGCLPCAKDTDEAIDNAKEALGVHLYGMEKDGDTIPKPSALESIDYHCLLGWQQKRMKAV